MDGEFKETLPCGAIRYNFAMFGKVTGFIFDTNDGALTVDESEMIGAFVEKENGRTARINMEGQEVCPF